MIRLQAVLALALLAACGFGQAPETEEPRPVAAATAPDPAPIRIVAWNANSGIPRDRATHDAQLSVVQRAVIGWSAADVVALSEVAPHWMDPIVNASGAADAAFGAIRGTTGCNQRLMILFDERRFELVGSDEMTGVPDGTNCRRAPLVATLRDRASGLVFELVAAHLLRGDGGEGDRERAGEAARMRSLLATRSAWPVIAIGDFNVDCPLATAPDGCALAFGELVAGGTLRWIEPETRRETTCSDRYTDMLDVAFAGRGAERWPARLTIDDDRRWCDEMQRGAHFPIELVVDP